MDDCDALMQISMHWSDIMKQILACSGCCKVPFATNIFICSNGHNTCEICLKETHLCSICRVSVGDIRNRRSENMVEHLKEMEALFVKKQTIGTQTEDNPDVVEFDNKQNDKNTQTDDSNKELYEKRCRTYNRKYRKNKRKSW